MVLPAGSVSSLELPVFLGGQPPADRAPVQSVSLVGEGFCAVGSGWLVEMIQSAFPAVSALVLSNSTRWVVAAAADSGAACTCAAAPAASATAIATPPMRPRAYLFFPSIRHTS